MVDSQILSVIEAEFKLDPDEVSESVTKLKLDSNYSLYYLTVQR
jgi:hypothetical protein